MYEDLQNIKTICVDTVVLNLHQIKERNIFGTPGAKILILRTKNIRASVLYLSGHPTGLKILIWKKGQRYFEH